MSRKRKQQLALALTLVGNGNGVPPLPEPALPEEEPPVPVEEPQLEPCESLEEMIPVQTASKRKLSMFAGEGSSTNDEECLIVDFSLLKHLIAPLACPLCQHSSLQIEKRKSQNLGFVLKLTVLCTSCKEDVSSSMLSGLLEDRSYDMNRRAVAASLVTEMGPTGLSKFCEVMNMPPLHHKTYASHVKFIGSKLPEYRKIVLNKASQKVREVYKAEDGVVDIDVS